jgi:hypothetical protein
MFPMSVFFDKKKDHKFCELKWHKTHSLLGRESFFILYELMRILRTPDKKVVVIDFADDAKQAS